MVKLTKSEYVAVCVGSFVLGITFALACLQGWSMHE